MNAIAVQGGSEAIVTPGLTADRTACVTRIMGVADRSWRSQEQKYLVLKPLAEKAIAFDKRLVDEEANKARSTATKEQHATSNPRAGEKSGQRTDSASTKKKKKKKDSRDSAAKKTGTNRGAGNVEAVQVFPFSSFGGLLRKF